MALINCPECKKQVSEHANSCPHCGYTFRRGETTVLKGTQRKSNRLTWVILIVFSFWLIGKCSSDESESTTAETKPKSEQQRNEQSMSTQKKGVVFTSAADFRQAFNTQSKRLSFDYKLDRIKVDAGEVQNTFTVKLAEEIMLLGIVSKQNSGVKEVMLIMGAGASAIDFLALVAILIATAEPNISADERGKILDDIGVFNSSAEELRDFNKSIQRNDIKYGFMANDVTGISFWITK